MRSLISVGLIFIFSCSLTYAQEYGAATNKRERKVLSLINSLPEVLKENKYRKAHKNPLLLKALIQSTPTKENNYYQVSVSENLGFQLRTYEWYEVDAKNFAIRYLDMASGKSISLAQELKLSKQKLL